MVTIFRNEIDDATKGVTKGVTKENWARVIIEMISKKSEITVNDITDSLNLTCWTLLRELKQLMTQN